ncbi:FAD-dependent oxidoreductase [Legionella parisiensis]|uniref:Uncharacterized protein n=1 Tax=Legionella parisiensis TaxID=45071 RepID=A0A1E5JWI3_9GAMM|nr:FAD-dependent oxidoreductase [Legionella parisiensis]KTD41783.1 4-hydroxybenzoate 3-monooxygenase [Legionella parisiensis]OEH48871.1 hypothetical protein lpari_00118 [Legionella parisiensis]STX75893.1 4-hydroxybenzoate 3-monooxygenase [Legionella parisiensis]
MVIIGAGPSGLYTAIQLKKAGVEDVIVYDPRAGEYVRPGHINSTVLERAEIGVGVKFNFPTDKTAHIKDVERLLWKHALSLGIPVEQKIFVGFSPDPKGVIVVDKEGKEEKIACDYVMDCTGSKRLVVNAVNEFSQAPIKPFKTSLVTEDVTVRNHLLAYVKIDERSLKVSNHVQPTPMSISGISSLEFARGMERLRQFGWHEFALPRCYNMPFGKDKACFYVETPDDLTPDQKETWLQAVLETRTGDDGISFQLLSDSKKYKNKPRLTTFSVNPMELSPFSHQEHGLPTVITQGDTQIDPNYFLAHGIIDSFDRIDQMIKGMKISGGKIIYFQQQDYEHDVQHDLEKHREALITHYKERKEYFIVWLQKAKGYYEVAIDRTKLPEEKLLFAERIKEIEGRIAYHNALKIVRENILVTPKLSDLIEAKECLMLAQQKLPSVSKEREDTNQKLNLLLPMFEDVGKKLYQEDNFCLALKAYQEALNLSRIQVPRDETTGVILHTMMISCYRKLHLGDKALLQAREALETCSLGTEIQKEIIFNAIKAAMEGLLSNKEENPIAAKQSIRMIAKFYCQYQEFIQHHLGQDLNAERLEMISILGSGDSLREQGDVLAEQGKFELALNIYQDALLMHRLSNYPSSIEWAGNLCASMMVIYRKTNRLPEGIPFANEVLKIPTLPIETKKKILFSVMKGGVDAINLIKERQEDISLVKELRQLYIQHKEFLKCELQGALKDELNTLDSLFDTVVSQSVINAYG